MATAKPMDKDDASGKNFKFTSLYAYNWDSPNNNVRKYRQVFDRWELKYLGVELTFFNKKFDVEDWDGTVTFKAFSMKKDKKNEELCSIEENIEVKKEDNTFVVNKGWGNEEAGKGWDKGEYIWEAYIGETSVGSTRFYIEEAGLVEKKKNPYFDVLSLKMYEGPDEGLPEGERKYLKKFDSSKTRYIFGEFSFASLLQNSWPCELFLTFYDDTRQLISRITFFDHINSANPGEDVFVVTEGWGNMTPGSWKEDDYTLEVEFQEQVIAVIQFSVGDTEQADVSNESDVKIKDDDSSNAVIDEIVARTLADARRPENMTEDELKEFEKKNEIEASMKELDSLIGLNSIKNQIREHVSYLDFLQVRKKMGIEDEDVISLHSVFIGNPGTGKTTVVKLLGKIYKAMGLLSRGNVQIVDSSDLVSGYVRQTGKTAKEEIEKARGGILFIDEAYMLYRKGVDNDFGGEAIAELITEMSDGPGDIGIMVAGYPAETTEMIGSNPGLKSRFKHYFHFDDYNPVELLQIADFAAQKKKITFTPAARKALEIELIRAYRMRDRTFGNARLVHSLVDESKINMGVRVMRLMKEGKVDQSMISTIEEQDVAEIFNDHSKSYVDIPPDEETLTVALRELDDLVGLGNIKSEIRDIIKLVRYYREIKKDIRKAFPIHSVFSGNPGTGKTTVARIMGDLYKALGILERGHVVETDASDLIAGYLGQTALKTKDKINEALGGVLFIDEAYSLADGQHPDFGKKAIETLIKQMDDRRGEFAVIVAGYPNPMQQFLESNPGMMSRFDQTFVFHDFSEEDLNTIALNMLAGADLTLEAQAAEYLKSYLSYLYQNRNQYFGNARSVRKIVDRMIIRQNLRMACSDRELRTEEKIHQVILEDLSDLRIDPHPTGKAIGFRPKS
jgi:SpoVK/Ycf46/Vps4 family AAA+-type ATPase